MDSDNSSPLEFIFLGTGTSSSLPHLDCLTAPPEKKPCRTCLSALTPDGKKNIRRNTSGVMRIKGKDGKMATVVIDTGKTFQAASVEWFPKYGLRHIDAVLITHAHADAMNGLDDLRGWTLRGAIQPHVDLYVSQTTYIEVQRSFPYLVSKEFASGGGDVPDFKWHIIEDKVPFEIGDTGIMVTPFSVHHGRLFSSAPPLGCEPTPHITPSEPIIPEEATPQGGVVLAHAAAVLESSLLANGHNDKPGRLIDDAYAMNGKLTLNGLLSPNGTTNNPAPTSVIQPYLCFGFKFQDDLVYISDVSHIPDDVWALLEVPRPRAGPLPMLVLDCLHLSPHTSHLGLAQAVEVARRIGAHRTFLIGFGHEVAHDEYDTILRTVGMTCDSRSALLERQDLTEVERTGIALIPKGEPAWIRSAFDGLRVEIGIDGSVLVDDTEYSD